MIDRKVEVLDWNDNQLAHDALVETYLHALGILQ